MNRQQIKKWSLLRHLNFKGYKRTASGNPLNMVKVMSPSQLTIYGNAVQDGTPSPDAPVEVQLCGDRTGNLLDYDVFDNAPEYVSNLSSIGCFAISVPNGAYTMSTNIEIKNNLNAGAFLIANSLPDTITSPLYGVSLNHPRTVTVSNGTLYVCVYWRNAGTGASYPHVFTKEDFTSGTYWLMLVQGSYTADTLPAYEPYGYKVSGRAEGLNLFDKENASIVKGAVMKTTLEFIGESDGAYSYMRCDPNTTYTINKLPQSGIVCTANQIPATGAVANSRISAAEEGMELSLITVTTGNDDTYLWIALIPSAGGEYTAEEMLDSLQVLKGTYTASTIPPYEPYQPPQDFAVYLPEQIAKVGDVADEITLDFEHKTATRTDKIKQLKDFVVASVVAVPPDTQLCITCRAMRLLNSDLFIPATPMLSNYFINGVFNNTSIEGIVTHSNPETDYQWYIYLNKTRIDMTADDTPATLATKCNAYIQTLTGREAYYQLLTPVTTDITSLQQWDAMPNIEGTVSITFDSAIPISNAETEYYSKEYDAT